MTRIRRLDPETRRRIAAGEVVTRPAAVVRELVENSLDAGASRIDVSVEGDGTAAIRVRDDGHGMGRADAERAVERYATSKLDGPDDVGRVSTLGFRGEALPSIAAVSRLTLTTNDGGPRGTRVRVAGDDGDRTERGNGDGDGPPGGVSVDPAGRARGTTVEVRDLFYNRPARRAQLSGAKAEFARVSELLSRYALCHPDTRFSLRHDDRETFSTPGTGYTDALLGVYDRSVAGQSTTFDAAFDRSADGTGADASNADASVGDSGDADAAVTVEGVLCYPAVTRATRDHVHVAVDGRPVADESLRRAVLAGYGSLLPADRAPVAAVSVRTPPGAVDHNVHPAKAEVAYRDDLPELVERAVGDALTTADLRRSAETAMDLDASLRPVEEASRFADVTVIGQFRGLYLLCAADDELLVVDQHAAHERINYERLRANVGDLPTEPVDPPATLSLSAPTAALVDSLAEELTRLGYEATTFGGGTVRVSRVPAPLGRTAAPESLRDALAALDGDAGGDPERVREDLLTEMACHPSLKAGDALSRDEGRALVERLGACDQPYACPHGRPTVLAIDEETLVRGFERGNTRLG